MSVMSTLNKFIIAELETASHLFVVFLGVRLQTVSVLSFHPHDAHMGKFLSVRLAPPGDGLSLAALMRVEVEADLPPIVPGHLAPHHSALPGSRLHPSELPLQSCQSIHRAPLAPSRPPGMGHFRGQSII